MQIYKTIHNLKYITDCTIYNVNFEDNTSRDVKKIFTCGYSRIKPVTDKK